MLFDSNEEWNVGSTNSNHKMLRFGEILVQRPDSAISHSDPHCRGPLAGQKCECQHLPSVQHNASDAVAVWNLGAGAGEGAREGIAGLASDERENCTGVYEGVVGGVGGIGMGARTITDTCVERDSDIWHLL